MPTSSPATPDATAEPAESTPASTRATFTRRAGRGYTPVRNILVQVPSGDKWVGSSLGRLVEARQPRALLAYLLLLLGWSWIERLEEPLEAQVWARALSPDTPDYRWPPGAMTRVWNTLDEHSLVKRVRSGHYVHVTPRREDGKADYSRPRPDESKKDRERFFAVPDAFWLDGWHQTLTFPGIAVLLILLSETQGRDQVHLRLDQARSWYGISPKTMQNGLNDLRSHGLLGERRDWVVNDLIAFGKVPRFQYWLHGDFSTSARRKLQRAAARESKKRAAKAEKAKAKES